VSSLNTEWLAATVELIPVVQLSVIIERLNVIIKNNLSFKNNVKHSWKPVKLHETTETFMKLHTLHFVFYEIINRLTCLGLDDVL